MTDAKRIILVHGAWGSGKSWGPVPRILARAGFDVVTLDLPGHGDDPTPPGTVGLSDYAARIVAELEQGPPALLVGHSMGGMAISAAAEAAPHLVRKLVYVCAFLPRDGDSLLSLKKREAHTIGAAVRPGPEPGTTVLDPDIAVDYLCHDASDRLKAEVRTGLVPQSNAAQTDAIHLTEARFGTVPRAYIRCLEDRTITPELQHWMQDQSPCAENLTLNCGHLPQMTAVPELCDLLTRL